jgi:hypothetical protein
MVPENFASIYYDGSLSNVLGRLAAEIIREGGDKEKRRQRDMMFFSSSPCLLAP